MNHDVDLIWEAYEDIIYEGIEQKMPHWLRKFPQFVEGEIHKLAAYDPTGDKGVYIPWILGQALLFRQSPGLGHETFYEWEKW